MDGIGKGASRGVALPNPPTTVPGRTGLLDDPTTAQTPSIIVSASARTTTQVHKLLRDAFVILTAEPELTKQARSQLRQTETGWMQALPPSPSPDAGLPSTSARGIWQEWRTHTVCDVSDDEHSSPAQSRGEGPTKLLVQEFALLAPDDQALVMTIVNRLRREVTLDAGEAFPRDVAFMDFDE